MSVYGLLKRADVCQEIQIVTQPDVKVGRRGSELSICSYRTGHDGRPEASRTDTMIISTIEDYGRASTAPSPHNPRGEVQVQDMAGMFQP